MPSSTDVLRPAAGGWIWPNGDSPKETRGDPGKAVLDYFDLAGFNLQGYESWSRRELEIVHHAAKEMMT